MPSVKLYGNLRNLVEQHQLNVPGETVRAVLENLWEGNDPLRQAVLEDGGLRSHVRITVNGNDIELRQGLATPVQESDSIAIFPPIAGGGR